MQRFMTLVLVFAALPMSAAFADDRSSASPAECIVAFRLTAADLAPAEARMKPDALKRSVRFGRMRFLINALQEQIARLPDHPADPNRKCLRAELVRERDRLKDRLAAARAEHVRRLVRDAAGWKLFRTADGAKEVLDTVNRAYPKADVSKSERTAKRAEKLKPVCIVPAKRCHSGRRGR